ncbi:MAG TPA: TIGR02186 family protein [Thermohalobaculum sp.]|nr:TIGR02186 family protein [Thermohalobaculum sp.]
MIRRLGILFAALFWASSAPAVEEKVIAGLSQTHVAITTDFSGSEIFIYGAIKRDAPVPKTWPLDVIVAVTGPVQPVIVRKKSRQFGIWVNDVGVQVDAAPSFYAVATTGPFRDVISHTDDLIHKVGLDQIVRLIGSPQDLQYPEEYREAAIRLRKDAGLYVELPGTVKVTDQTLFETRVRLPANLVEGDYRARIFLLREKSVIDVFESSIEVRKVGLERWIYTMAQEQSALYGLLSILVALSAGWMASTFFRLVFR